MKSFRILPFLILLLPIGFPALAAEPTPRALSDIVEKAKGSVVSVIVSDAKGKAQGSGTGFVVSSDGKIVTCAHIVKDSQHVSIKFSDGRTLPAKNINLGQSGEERDLVIITVEAKKLIAIEIGDSREVKVGEKIAVIGSPLGLDATVTEGILSALRTAPDSDLPLLQISAALSPGSSGSPVFDGHGKVIGVAQMGAKQGDSLNFAIPLKPSDGYEFGLGNIWPYDWGKKMSWIEEDRELKGDQEFARRDRRDKDLTEEDWKWLAARHPKNSEVSRRQAYAPFQSVDSRTLSTATKERALILLRKSLSLNRMNTMAWSQIAQIATELKRFDEAIEARRAILEVDPEDATHWANLGEALKNNGNIDGAIMAYRRGVEVSSEANELAERGGGWQDLCFRFAALLVRAGKGDDALAVAERGVRPWFDVRDPFAVQFGRPEPVNEGVKLFVEGKRDEAAKLFKKALISEPEGDDIYAFYNLGVLHLRAKAYAESVSAFESAVALAKPQKDWDSERLARFAELARCVAKAKGGEIGVAKELLAKLFSK